MKDKVIKVLKLVVPLGIGVYLIWYFFQILSEEEKKQLFNALKEANYWWIIPSLMIGFLSHMSRAYRWKYLLEPMGYKPSFKRAYNALMIGYIVNLVLPRAGEASRAAVLKRTDDVPFEKSFGTIIMERLVDVIMLGIIFLITLATQFEQFDLIKERIKLIQNKNGQQAEGSGWGIWILIGVALISIVGVIVVLKNEKFKTKIFNLIKGAWDGFKSILHSKNKVPFLIHTVFIWVMYILMFGVCFQALPSTSSMPVAGILAGFIAGTLGLIFVQGGIGVYPALVGIITTIYIFPEYTASPIHPVGIALGWIIWSSQTILMVVLGLISMLLTPAKKVKENELP